ncbi:hypothetical protein EU803_00665 [Loktanella sp. IMCC34160]|uniref:hypothetical protein n=1 Tax=Loktanella sp. IMCC34160 TaxID=2510646 RepID=UPI00101D2851|nr:hypothetical protein [Loktanella sp. IMCC34160]RYG92651.1 hypothetical protein EU803_00665 [Loktanella sp. IMCC34160]
MTKIDQLVAELCDEFMIAAAAGDLPTVRENLTQIFEYAAYEIARTGCSDLSISVFNAAAEVDKRFRRAEERIHTTRLEPIKLRLG